MRKSVLDAAGVVVDVVLAGDDWLPPDGFVIGPPGGEIGHVWNGSSYETPPPIEPVDGEAVSAPPQPAPSTDMARLALAVNLANNAIINGVQAGDYRWHGGATDFEWEGQRMDAPGLIEYARTLI